MGNGLKNKIKKLLFKNTVARDIGLSTYLPFILKFEEDYAAKSLRNRINKNTSILDVGSGSGELIEALYSLGYKNVEGADPFIPKNLNINGLNIVKAYVTNLNENKKYDLIMLHHSFEHMANPEEVLKKIKNLLNENGQCIIRIPVCDSYSYELYKKDWVQLDAPRHVFLHTNKSMEILSKSTGMKIDKIENDSNSFQFIGSEQYKRGISLSSANSYFKPFYKKIFYKKIFSNKDIKDFKRKSEELNSYGKGDQRIFILKKMQN